jgi:uncharacterized membrane protein
MGSTLAWYSSLGSDFNYDFQVTLDESVARHLRQRSGSTPPRWPPSALRNDEIYVRVIKAMISVSGLNYALTLVTALGCGTIAGVFFAFSTFVMKALARLSPEQGIAAMQSINVLAVNSWFLAAFIGTAALCVVSMVAAAVQWNEPFALFMFLGGLAYIAGCFLVTVFFNVPMNNALAALPATAPDRVARWTAYLANWTTWNHVRTVASLVAAALLSIGLSRIS